MEGTKHAKSFTKSGLRKFLRALRCITTTRTIINNARIDFGEGVPRVAGLYLGQIEHDFQAQGTT